MNYNIGDFIITLRSYKPAFIISKDMEDNFLVSITEFYGDYIWITKDEINNKPDLTIDEKLSILANFGDWFYEQHKILYQELIIEKGGHPLTPV